MINKKRILIVAAAAALIVWWLRGRPVRLRECAVCGCDDAHACFGGCYWAKTDPPICSACMLPGTWGAALFGDEHDPDLVGAPVATRVAMEQTLITNSRREPKSNKPMLRGRAARRRRAELAAAAAAEPAFAGWPDTPPPGLGD